jgi:ATP-dependent RNA helicase DDX5/DBP2
MCKQIRADKLALCCRCPRRSKLQRLRRLQKRARSENSKSEYSLDSRKRRQVKDLGPPPKKTQVNEQQLTSAATAAAASDLAPSDAAAAATASEATSPVDALRAQLQLHIEDDPYGDCPAPIREFDELANLPKHVLASLKKHGITTPMPIQAQALPLVLSGRDVIGLAQTGSGKTLAFLLPASVHLEKQRRLSNQTTPKLPSPLVLVLAPTRELAVQIADEANKVFDSSFQHGDMNHEVHTVAVYGGGDKFKQQRQLGWGSDIVVATPGRLTDFVNTHVLTLDRVGYFVLDEGDRMLDMGFHDDVASISKQTKPERQMLFFSATWGKEVQELAQGLCRSGSKPVRISYGRESDATADGVAKHKAREGIVQEVVVVDHVGDKHWELQEADKEVIMDKHLKNVLTASDDHKVLVFVSQKHLADKLSDRLQSQGFKADSMHGGKSQDYRLWVLDQFRKGELRLLVCTDVLGRGIDIPSVSHVVIHEMGDIEDYIHRIGRTARGRYGKGHALVFFEYWEGNPDLAAELKDVLVASKQIVPTELQRIVDEVANGKRQSRTSAPKWNGGKQQWKASSFSNW